MVLDPRTFIGQCVAGNERPDAIDDWVERWHTSNTGATLHDFLGMTWEEYSNVASAPDVLPLIIEIRRKVEAGRAALVAAVTTMDGKLN